MSGLPPVPPDVAHLELTALISTYPTTIGFWLRNPDWPALDGPHAESFFAQVFSTVMPNFLSLMHQDSSFSTCRLATNGFVAESFAPPNVGEWFGATEIGAASGLKWTTRESGRRGWAMTYVPALPSAFVADHAILNATGYGTLRAQGLLALSAFNHLVGPLGGVCELGTLQRKNAAGPLPAALFVGYQDVYPINKVVRCGRRVPPSGRTLPL